MRYGACAVLAAAAGLGPTAGAALGQSIDPFYAGNYSIVDLGTAPGVPGSYGGINFLPGDSNVLLIGGQANSAGGAIYRVGVVRDGQGNITGYAGPATVFSTAAGIDGGLARGPGNVMFFTTYPTNTLGQIKPGSAAPDRIVQLGPLGVANSTGSCVYVPGGFPGAGQLKIMSYNASLWYSTVLSADGNGTFNVDPVGAGIFIGGSPEGAVYVPTTSPQFGTPSVLVTEYGNGRVVSYEVNGNGDPIVSTRRVFATNLGSIEGAALDPVTGQFLFTSFAGAKVWVVRGFAPPAACYANCDGSTESPLLAATDFSCFLSRFVAAQALPVSQQAGAYPNCDGSTTFPSLNALDFGCFLQRYRAGCSN